MLNITSDHNSENIAGDATVSEKLDALIEYLGLEVADHPIKDFGGKVLQKKDQADKILFEKKEERYY